MMQNTHWSLPTSDTHISTLHLLTTSSLESQNNSQPQLNLGSIENQNHMNRKSIDTKNHLKLTSVDYQNIWTSNQVSDIQLASKSLQSHINWQPNQLNLKPCDSQIGWISNQLTTKSVESQTIWQPNQLNLKSTDNQLSWTSNKISWISNQSKLQPKSFEWHISWHPTHLNRKPLNNYNHLKHTSIDNQVIWTSNQLITNSLESQNIRTPNHLNLTSTWQPKSFESHISWQPTRLNPKTFELQITWISHQLTTKIISITHQWTTNSLESQNVDNQIIWISTWLTTKSLESQINWQPPHLKLNSTHNQNHLKDIDWQPNRLNLKSLDNPKRLILISFESDINSLSNQLNSAHPLPIGSLSLETSAAALCGRYVKSRYISSPYISRQTPGTAFWAASAVWSPDDMAWEVQTWSLCISRRTGEVWRSCGATKMMYKISWDNWNMWKNYLKKLDNFTALWFLVCVFLSYEAVRIYLKALLDGNKAASKVPRRGRKKGQFRSIFWEFRKTAVQELIFLVTIFFFTVLGVGTLALEPTWFAKFFFSCGQTILRPHFHQEGIDLYAVLPTSNAQGCHAGGFSKHTATFHAVRAGARTTWRVLPTKMGFALHVLQKLEKPHHIIW